MLKLNDVMTQKIPFPSDIMVNADIVDKGRNIGYRWYLYFNVSGWKMQSKDTYALTETKVVLLLQEKDYHQVLMTTDSYPFNGQWHYRATALPEWDTFRTILLTVYEARCASAQRTIELYHDSETETLRQQAQDNQDKIPAYNEVIRQLQDSRPTPTALRQWARGLKDIIGQNYCAKSVYLEFASLLREYQEKITEQTQTPKSK